MNENLIYIKNIKLNNGSDEKNFLIRLSENEKNFLISSLGESSSYLEFGSGGSTFLALKSEMCKKIISVESDAKWLDYMRTFASIKNAQQDNRLYFEYVNIGQTGEWGIPLDASTKELFPNYSNNVFKKFENDYDLVFIDGRFRVACVMQTILNCMHNVKIVIHDYNNRPEYHFILKYLNIDYTIDTMALFSIKNNVDKNDVLMNYENFKFDYR